jgi:hypothetical protein
MLVAEIDALDQLAFGQVAVRVLVARGNRGRSDLAATRREVPRSAVDPGNR